jgi:type IV pilus assembly protein PilW
MLAMLIGLIIVVAVATIYLSTVRGSADTVKSAQLNHDMGTAALVMINDIRRAGYWGGAVTGSDPKDNPFVTGTANIQIIGTDCILYTYDADGSGFLTPADQTDDVDANEYYGFKLNNGTIEMRLTGTTTADCDDGNWVDLLDGAEISITNLDFSFVPDPTNIPNVSATSRCLNASTSPQEVSNKDCATAITDGDISSGEIVETRQVLYSMTGTLVDDNTVTKTLSGSVKVRNDRFFTQP